MHQYANAEVRKHKRHFLETNFLPYIKKRSSFTKATRTYQENNSKREKKKWKKEIEI
jgi:hypothetical protein